MPEQIDPGQPVPDPLADRAPSFPSYEEFAAEILDALDSLGLSIEDIRHEVEPGLGERTFECTVRLSPEEATFRYHAHVSFEWDALLTYLATYGPGADCELYHDEEEAQDCPHHRLVPQPFVELRAEFVLGDGGYELQEVAEVSGWITTVQTLLAKAFTGEDRPSVHVGLAALGDSILVEKFSAEHSWLIDFDEELDLGPIGRQIHAALRVLPQLADRLPI